MALNILLTRIDNRLVHGQVGVTWTSSLGANLLVVVDDEAASDRLQQQLMTMTAENAGVGIRFFTVEKTIQIIGKASDSQKIFIVCKNPGTVKKLIDGGVPIEKVNVGNMHPAEGKKQITKKVHISPQEEEEIRYIASKGVYVFFQEVPEEPVYEIGILD
ncbi:PTS galactosamine transporter subunit IIB [Sebaldella sp. S0638]|uniref:PTS galactosamine transporter subunit IIB n=1 Tax=Sebaldella sp. S0638 TaxID=2957809 RepID=UPI00209DC3A6|nr:PTS galactosamine transporter subunit IIB [Sebaldella sp. S0638]MCP1224126.1 PTS galactosamine transporter subunit IIB [Sebaldella sp. S0638]